MKCITILKKAPLPVGHGPDVRSGVGVEQVREAKEVGVEGSEMVDHPVIILEVAIRRRGHGTGHVARHEEQVCWGVVHSHLWTIEHLLMMGQFKDGG